MASTITILPPSSGVDPRLDPQLFDGITLKRILAYGVDLIVVALVATVIWVGMGVLGILTLGLLLPLQALAVALVPLAYHSLLIASPSSATIGMRLFGIRVVSLLDGAPPSLAQAVIQIVAFYGSVTLTAWLVLIVALFNPRRRTLHDFLAGTVVINAEKRL
ncbi:RDD family protein [Magnetospirillum sulfuroxidans]|uniref:RDD family protein n=1 Tax=Magnetospirillum sulfuroxidans TaxID=611300 RepID=A0ABS5I9V2_9PROT|nr:RDD family protein [Magnetospirillum sulfuroxidans]MBR9970523.1 RDD family protein [Magnetospirillum sulfuroxidans]